MEGISWPQLANQLIIKEFDIANERGGVDSVVSYIHSTSPNNIDSPYFNFKSSKAWSEFFDGLTNYVTEWNLRSNRSVLDKHEDYALKQAHALINMANFLAKKRPLNFAFLDRLVQERGQSFRGRGEDRAVYSRSNVSHACQNLPSTGLVDLTDGFGNETEVKDSAADAHPFHSDEKMVAYVTSTSEHSSTNSFDFPSVMTSTGAVTITLIGVAQR